MGHSSFLLSIFSFIGILQFLCKDNIEIVFLFSFLKSLYYTRNYVSFRLSNWFSIWRTRIQFLHFFSCNTLFLAFFFLLLFWCLCYRRHCTEDFGVQRGMWIPYFPMLIQEFTIRVCFFYKKFMFLPTLFQS